MQTFDPWAGYNAGMQTIGSTLDSLSKDRLLREQTERQNRLSDLQMQREQMTLSELARKQRVEEGARAAVVEAQPKTLTSIISRQPQVDIPVPGAQYIPQPRPLTGSLESEMAGNGLATQSNNFKMEQPAASETVQAYNEGRVSSETKPVNRDKVLMDYYRANDPAKALEFEKVLLDKYKALADSNPEAALQWYSELSGQDFKYAGTKGEYSIATHTATGRTVAINKKNPKDVVEIFAGGDPKAEYKQRTRNIGNTEVFEESQDGGKTWKQVGQPAPRYKPGDGAPKPEKDLPAGIQEAITNKVTMAKDWQTIKDTFKPEYMPKIAFKNMAEFRINLAKVFGSNQDAVDWWTQYFDARNLLIKDRSGAAVTEPEFKRFEQGSIAANTSPQTVMNYLDRSVKKYKSHADAYIKGNSGNHKNSVEAFTRALEYEVDAPKGKGKSDPLGIRGGR